QAHHPQMVLSGKNGRKGDRDDRHGKNTGRHCSRDPRECPDHYTGRTTNGIDGFFMNFSA
ncbi:MAG TPA: hypothetical protein VN416_01365, partial [Desulfomonilia bacterium]|nr:hypothetical protein [Desulfomonilia bacterium]